MNYDVNVRVFLPSFSGNCAGNRLAFRRVLKIIRCIVELFLLMDLIVPDRIRYNYSYIQFIHFMEKTMTKDSKADSLRRHGALNPHPERVSDELFRSNSFFDPRDLVQVKYEMLRRVREDDDTIRDSAQRFGLSRFTWYQAQHAFDLGGLQALSKRKPGPRRRHKLSGEVIAALLEARTDKPRIPTPELVAMVKERFDAFDLGGLQALSKRKPGPRRRHKLSGEVIAALLEARTDKPRIPTPELVAMVKERFGLSVVSGPA